MLLVCDVGNTNVSVGVFDREILLFHSKLSTVLDRSSDEYALLFSGVMTMNHVDSSAIDGAIISSVVRPLSAIIYQAIETLCGVRPLQVGPGVKTGLNIKTDIPSQIGADLVANAVGATHLSPCPLVIIALGTATTLTVISENCELCGVIICPGVRSSLDALSESAADLPCIALDSPKSLLGRNTIDSMQNGIIYGSASMVDGLIDRIKDEIKREDMYIIATGGLADKIIPYCKESHKIRIEKNLTLLGLKKIFDFHSHRKPDIRAT